MIQFKKSPCLPIRLLAFVCIAYTAFPCLIWGHGAEFIQAKLSFDAEQQAVLEMTADYGDNPMFNGIDDARDALRDILRVEVQGQWLRLSDLAALNIAQSSKLDLTSPLAYSKDANNQPHQLLVATWRWSPTIENLSFQVPAGCKHDVLFWLAMPVENAENKVWKLLIAEDKTPSITVPKQDFTLVRALVELSGLGVIALVLRALWRMDWKD